ncbi:MAG: MBL fold metallo-hydrolase [Dehalococcoidia bacterium]|nr:MBL fold metallo-hydrolase [Dehalococcoidia bacterium]
MKREEGVFRIILAAAVLMFFTGALSCTSQKEKNDPATATAALDTISRHCQEQIGDPRIERVSEHVWASLGYDLSNTVLIHTAEGNVIVDTSLNPTAARAIKRAFSEAAPQAAVKAIIYTHSHVDHTMGTTVWVENTTRIWATDSFATHWFKQFGLFGRSESVRGMRQMGYHISREEVPCSAIGPVMRTFVLDDMAELGPLMPTDTFSGMQVLDIGGVKIEMYSAPGETHDQLIVWIPADKTLLAADDFYWAFPNLYTIRGASPRPTDEWIKSIDDMRRLEPEHLVPGHTSILHGRDKIQDILTDYRDAIQYVRDDVVRRANRGEDIDTIAESVKLPAELARLPYLWEGYGQVDWSARAIYTNNMGWFDGRADKLYPLPHAEVASREIAMMGGPQAVATQAGKALVDGDARWAIHLLSKLNDSGLATGSMQEKVKQMLAEGYRQIAADTANTNGRAYLLESALELTQGVPVQQQVALPVETVASIPIDFIFINMSPRLDPAKAAGVHESVLYQFPDTGRQFTVTVRNSVAEVVEGQPLPGTPQPLATLTTDSLTYKMIALKMLDLPAAFAQGKISVEGDLPALIVFMGRFQT